MLTTSWRKESRRKKEEENIEKENIDIIRHYYVYPTTLLQYFMEAHTLLIPIIHPEQNSYENL